MKWSRCPRRKNTEIARKGAANKPNVAPRLSTKIIGLSWPPSGCGWRKTPLSDARASREGSRLRRVPDRRRRRIFVGSLRFNLSMALLCPASAGLSLVQEHQTNARRYSLTMDEILIGVAVLCVVALALLLTVKIEPR
jgi:hypothetical protein